MAKKQPASLSAAVSAEIKSKFDLDKFKTKKGLDKNVKFKDQEWIPLSPAFQEVTSIPGIPMGHIVMLRGHSDTGKTTAMIEAAVSAQQKGILAESIIITSCLHKEVPLYVSLFDLSIFSSALILSLSSSSCFILFSLSAASLVPK